MNSVVWVFMVACISGSQAGILPVNPGGIGGLFRGPNSETIIRGPDGSEITSAHIGGTVETESRLEPIIVPDYSDDQIAVSSVTSSPAEAISITNNIEGVAPTSFAVIPETSGVNQQTSISAASIPQTTLIQAYVPVSTSPALTTANEPHIIETELVDAPDVEPNQSSDLEGPSGSITVRGSSSIISGPASTTISEPVRRIPVATLPLAAPQPAVPSAVLIPPSPEVNFAAIDNTRQNYASDLQSTLTLNTNLVPPALPNVQIPSIPPSYSLQPTSYSSLNTELVPPPPPNTQITLSGTSGASIADASLVSPQTQSISSTPIPSESLPPNAIDLGQTIVSITQRSIVTPSTGDVDVSRINLGRSDTQQLSIGPSGSVSSTVSPIDGQNVVSSTSATGSPISIQTSLVSQQNEASSLSPDRPLFTTASDTQAFSNLGIQANISPTSSLSGPNVIFTPNGADGRTYSQDQSIITNQIISNTARPTTISSSNLVGSTRVPNNDVQNNIPSWFHVEPDQILPTASSTINGRNGEPISSILDTVLVQPTDPKNREIIEFGGKQLENVGNIVPVLHQPVIVTGGLTHIHNIPTASVSQLTSGNNFKTDDFNRYERQRRNKN